MARVNRDPSTEKTVRQEEVATALVTPAASADNMDVVWPVGSFLDGRYRVLEVRGGAGKSGMGVVYIVADGERKYAVKTFQQRFAQELTFIQRFIREAQMWMLVGFHPNIVRAYALDIIEATPYLFMEYVEGDAQGRYSVADYLAQGPLSLAQGLDFALQFCAGMIHATSAAQGLVHRDIKPENLLVSSEGVLKITDFGLVGCKACQCEMLSHFEELGEVGRTEKSLTQVGTVFGTPAYMAPEQFEEARSVTLAADVYAFGCCMYEWFCGMPPFQVRARSTQERIEKLRRQHRQTPPRPLTERMADCPAALSDVIARCLEKKPQDRWPDFETLQAALLGVVDACGVNVKPLLKIPDPSPREVAEQMRSLTLLEGYAQAIRLRNLREHQNQSPYAFHLALASYFHCEQDTPEEARQLAKALRVRDTEMGYEAVRRWADLLLLEEKYAQAGEVLETFLTRCPDCEERVLEPYVRWLAHQKRYDDALGCLATLPISIRTQFLQTEVFQKKKDYTALIASHKAIVAQLLDHLAELIAGLTEEDSVGFAYPDDAGVLTAVLASLRPEINTEILKKVTSCIWPDLRGYPDFAPDMAWLSESLGALASSLKSGESSMPCPEYEQAAQLLGYPHRFHEQNDRDEYWFWMQEEASC